jgi:hypothetical protein
MTVKQVKLPLVFSVIIIYYLNDFLFIQHQENYYSLISIDYISRIVSLLILIVMGYQLSLKAFLIGFFCPALHSRRKKTQCGGINYFVANPLESLRH